MTTWFYLAGQEQIGPIDDDVFNRRIEEGTIGPYTYVWRVGMDNWQFAGEHPDIAHLLVVPPPPPAPKSQGTSTPQSTAAPISPKIPQPAFEPVETKPGVTLTSRPWPRFLARTFDILLIMPLVGFGIGYWTALYAPELYVSLVSMNPVLYGLLVYPLVATILAISMTLTGYTPGKALLGVKVPVPEGRTLFYFKREFEVWIYGLGLAIPIVSLFTYVKQYRLLKAGNPASYDEGNPPVIADPGTLRMIIACALVALLFIGNAILRTEDNRMSDNLSLTQTWVNPLTGRSADFGQTWQLTPMETDIGSVYYFVSNELLSEAIFGHETISSDFPTVELYAAALEKALASQINFLPDWKAVEVNGVNGLRATGRSVQFPDANVEVTVAVIGNNAWRTLTFYRGSSSAQTTEKDRFVHAMFGTAN